MKRRDISRKQAILSAGKLGERVGDGCEPPWAFSSAVYGIQIIASLPLPDF